LKIFEPIWSKFDYRERLSVARTQVVNQSLGPLSDNESIQTPLLHTILRQIGKRTHESKI